MEGQNLNTEPTENLMEYIRWKDQSDYMEIAKEAFRIFTFRFQLDLQKKIIPICKKWSYDEHVASEIAYKTFNRVWKYPTFDTTKSKQKDYDTGIRFWLYAIASHELADYKKIEGGEVSPFTGNEEVVYDFPDIVNMDIRKERKADLLKMQEHIMTVLSRLSNKHRVIYLTYKQYETEVKDGYKLPRKLLKKLRDELDLTQSTVRVYKKEAFDEVETYIKVYGSK